MNTGVLDYLINKPVLGGTFPLAALIMSIFFIILITLSILAYFDKKEGNRERYFKSIIVLVVAAFVISSAYVVAQSISKVIELKATIYDISAKDVGRIVINEFGKTVGFWERAVYSLLDIFAGAAIWVRDFIIGQSGGTRQILNRYSSNVLVSFKVSYDGSTINLYNLILISSSFLLFIMVVNSGLKLAKYSYQSNTREDVIKAFQKWFYVILLMLIIPAAFITATKIMDTMMSILNKINSDFIISTDSLTVEAYGPLAPIAKIYIAYLEFKVYVLMLFRKFIINIFFITVPITVYLWGVSDNFDSMTLWINTLLSNIFSPIFYSLTFVVGSLILRSLENGDNPIVMIIISSLCLKIGDELKKITQWKNSGSILGGSNEISGISKTIFTAAMLAKSAYMIMSKNGMANTNNTSNSSSASNSNNIESNMSSQSNMQMSSTANARNTTSNSNLNSNSSSNTNSQSAKALGINSNTLKKGAQVVAGVAAGIATGNPLLGYATYKGSGTALNTVGNVSKGIMNTAKSVQSGVEKIGNYFQGNSDIKAHRRD